MDCDRKVSLNQHHTTSSGHRGGNRGKIRQAERRHGLTQLLVESFSEIRRNRVRCSICVRRRYAGQLKQDWNPTSPVLAKRPETICQANALREDHQKMGRDEAGKLTRDLLLAFTNVWPNYCFGILVATISAEA